MTDPAVADPAVSGAQADAVATPTVTIAVCTYLRNDELTLAVEGLAPQAAAARADVEILVVDNDPAGGARAAVDALATTCPVPLRYAHEPRPGIAAARNRCLDETDRDLLVFVDDDEHPRPGWLQRLLDVKAETGASAVTGPVESEFSSPLDPWIDAGGFFRRGRYPTGSLRPIAATNNLLLDRAEIARRGLRFDERFGLTGGSDTTFTQTLTRGGGTIVWVDDAVMVDRTPPERATRKWVLRRVYRFGNATGRRAIMGADGRVERWRVRAHTAAGGLARIVTGWGRVWFGRLIGSTAVSARGRRRVSRGAGFLSAALGRTHVEYARPGRRR